MIRMLAVRSIWYSRSESVWLGAITILSPVCTPIGSRFSMLQTMMHVSARSRITSYSISFHPATDRSTSTCPIRLTDSPSDAISSSARASRAIPPPVPPERVRRPHDDRIADARGERASLLEGRRDRAIRDRLAEPHHRILELLAIFGHADRLERRAQEAHVVPIEHARFGETHREIQARLAAERREQPLAAAPWR